MTNKKHYRLYVINKLPQVRVLDFQKVKLKVSAIKSIVATCGYEAVTLYSNIKF